jgi:hypothetical protein
VEKRQNIHLATDQNSNDLISAHSKWGYIRMALVEVFFIQFLAAALQARTVSMLMVFLLISIINID